MIICVCKNISESKINFVCKNNTVQNLKDLKQHIDCGSQCGKCLKEIMEIIKENKKVDLF